MLVFRPFYEKLSPFEEFGTLGKHAWMERACSPAGSRDGVRKILKGRRRRRGRKRRRRMLSIDNKI